MPSTLMNISAFRLVSRVTLTSVFVTVGCAQLLGLREDVPGEQCAVNADCPPSKKCAFSVCSAPCRVDKDCAVGSRCLQTNGAAVCVQARRAGCSADGGQPHCPDDTSCAPDQTCRNVCEAGCHLDQTCRGTFCVGTDPSHDGVTKEPDGGNAQGVDAAGPPVVVGADCRDAGIDDASGSSADGESSISPDCRSCTPGAKQCSNNRLQTCDGDGHFTLETECAQPAPRCADGECVCPEGNTVSNGVCCPNRQTGCGGACVDLRTDPNNCGGCSLVCGTPGTTSVRCQGGSCIETCDASQANCNGAAGDGCECIGNGCCGSNCQTQHSNGLKGFFYDCNPPKTYTLAAAIAACTEFTRNSSLCASCSSVTPWGVSVVQATSFGPMVATWVWNTGSFLGPGSTALYTNFDCSNGGTTTQCNTTCKSTFSHLPNWD